MSLRSEAELSEAGLLPLSRLFLAVFSSYFSGYAFVNAISVNATSPRFLSSLQWVCGSLICLHLLASHPTQAQTTPDHTLSENSVVTFEGDTIVITRGTRSGTDLFHSFREFSVRTRERASFRGIDPEIDRIFTRVTGASASQIDGAIEALQANGSLSSADFFLLNPHGIFFGPNASLNLGGSFLATTANRIRFANGAEFSAVNPQSAPLLTVSTPIGLQFGRNPGRITNQSFAPVLDSAGEPILTPIDPRSDSNAVIQGLRVLPGETLALVGGDLRISGGRLTTTGGQTAAGGRIELGSVVSPDSVTLAATDQGWSLNYDRVREFGDIEISGFASVNASGTAGGAIQIQGRQITLAGFVSVFSYTFGNENGGDLSIHASRLELSNYSILGTKTYGSGRGGNVAIVTDQLIAQDGSQIFADTQAQGQGGELSVSASNLIELVGYMLDANEVKPSALFALSGENATGQGGAITVATNQLRILAGAQINADNLGSGNGGAITIRATQMELAGVAASESGEPLLIAGDVIASPSAVSAFARRSSSGNGGNITIATQRLSLRDGAAIQATTTSSGDAGNIDIQATEWVEAIGLAPDQQTPTSLITFSGGTPGVRFSQEGGFPDATGQGGDLSITTGDLIVRDGAVVAVGSLNPDETEAEGAGNLKIQAQTVYLDNQGSLLARTASGDGGDISLQISDLLLLRRHSQISTTAGTIGTGGNGGDIAIDANFILAAPSENSDITANAFTGNGGNIRIDANLLGIEAQTHPTSQSDITATSEQGVNGAIIINSPDIDPSQGLTELPSTPIQTELAQGCQVEGDVASAEFFNTGRGGIPASPYEPLSESAVLDDVRLPVPPNSPNQADASPVAPVDRPIEAQGWVMNDRSQVVLVAEIPANPLQSRCHLR